jgi:hypothetical protein
VQKHPPDAHTPPGLEWWILKRLTKVSAVTTLAFGLAWCLIRIWLRHGTDSEITSQMFIAEYTLLGAFIFFITMVVTIGISCVFVSVMKGPRYSADSYIINDKEKPSSTRDG